MWKQDPHLSDQKILMELEGELSAREAKKAGVHLKECWRCRARRQDIESAIADFVRVHQRELDAKLPPAVGPRALLKAQLAQLSEGPPSLRAPLWLFAGATACLLAMAFLLVYSTGYWNPSRPSVMAVSVPDSRLTPGATLLMSRPAVCSQENAKNKAVPAALQRRVFEEYGIKGAEPRAYEVDYLITPALGGADDIRNLWPHSYSAVMWNARVKDDLEDRLREMVCEGTLDLSEAQQELASDWIAAYKKYFHTEKPLNVSSH